eukprot:1089737-Rhodomonas_salina.1
MQSVPVQARRMIGGRFVPGSRGPTPRQSLHHTRCQYRYVIRYVIRYFSTTTLCQYRYAMSVPHTRAPALRIRYLSMAGYAISLWLHMLSLSGCARAGKGRT